MPVEADDPVVNSSQGSIQSNVNCHCNHFHEMTVFSLFKQLQSFCFHEKNVDHVYSDAFSHLYKRLFPSIGLSVGPSIGPSIGLSIRLSVGPSVNPSVGTSIGQSYTP